MNFAFIPPHPEALGRQHRHSTSPVRRSLNPIQLSVLPTPRHEILMGPDLDNVRAVEHDDEMGHADCAEAVGDEDRDA
ncbi:MAG: hypothetical protein ACRD1T_16020, partial [Acidimicrobiia bacterium]